MENKLTMRFFHPPEILQMVELQSFISLFLILRIYKCQQFLNLLLSVPDIYVAYSKL